MKSVRLIRPVDGLFATHGQRSVLRAGQNIMYVDREDWEAGRWTGQNLFEKYEEPKHETI